MKTENIEITVPRFERYKYTGEYRYAENEEYYLSAYGSDVQFQANGPSPAKVLIMERIK